MKKSYMFIIPVYNPTISILKKLLKQIKKKNIQSLFVIDGSIDEEIFNAIVCTSSKYIILKNKVNRGKGFSIKKGIKYILTNLEYIKYCTVIDCDGQHDINDGIKFFNILNHTNADFVIGARNLNKIPFFKNYFGNYLSSFIYSKLINKRILDAQCGLRGMNIKAMKLSLKIRQDRFDYETQQILYFYSLKKFKIITKSIKTIYSKNYKTNFRSITDTFSIIWTLFESIINRTRLV